MENLTRLFGQSNPFVRMIAGLIPAFTLHEGEGGGGGTPASFLEGLPEEMRANPSITKFKDVPGMAKSYIELEKLINAKGVIIPGDSASEQEVADFHKTLGRPDTSEGYQFEAIEGLDGRIAPSEESTKAFKDMAHKLGLNPKVATELRKWYFAEQANALKGFDEATTNEAKETETLLRKDWGSKYTENKALAQKVLKAYGDESLASLIKEEGSNPAFIKLLASVGAHLSEDKLGPKGSGGGTLTAAEATAKIAEIRNNPKHAYHDDQHPEHKVAVDYMRSLYLMETPPEDK